jgi:hypothetical protein
MRGKSMRLRLTGLALFALLATFASGQAPPSSTSIGASGVCATITTTGYTQIGIQVTGTFSLTLQPAVSIAGQAVQNTTVTPSNSTTPQSTITAAGLYYAMVAGTTQFSLCASSYVSGTAVVWFQGSKGTSAGIGFGSSSGSSGASLVTSGLLAEYKFLDGSGTALSDSSGNGNAGTLCTAGNAPTWLPNTFTTQTGPGGGLQKDVVPGTGGLSFAGSSSQCVVLPSALNPAKTYILYTQFNPTTGSSNNQGVLMGTGASTQTSGLQYNFQDLATLGQIQPFNVGVSQTATRAGAVGVHCVGVTHDTLDHVYVDGQEVLLYHQQNAGTIPSSGVYQLGGSAAGSRGNFFTGQIFYAAFWNRVLTPSEVAQMCANPSPNNQSAGYVPSLMMGRGVTQPYGFLPNLSLSVNSILADGDSLVNGNNGNFTPPTSFLSGANFLNGTWQWANIASQGTGMITTTGFGLNMDTQAPDIWYTPNAERSAVVLWAGTNDIARALSANNVVGGMRNYCNARHAKGWKCFIVSMISRTGQDTGKNTLNGLIRQEWPTFADGLIDFGELELLGKDGASANANIFSGDGLHPTTATDQWLEAKYISRVLNRYYGNTNFTSANTYGSANAAGVTITAASETGNIATFTFAAITATVGQEWSISGVTPSGYNNPCVVQTTNATTITCWMPTTGLGAGSVFGTAQLPQQVDADQYYIVNFGAGNSVLQSCSALTGQNVFIKNINAAGTTIVPSSAELIDGATSVTLASKATLELQSVLTGATTGGCSWKQIQNN